MENSTPPSPQVIFKNKKSRFKGFVVLKFMFSPLEGFVPRSHKLNLMDIRKKHLMGEIAAKLGVSYLSDSNKPKLEEVSGIIWGDNKRIFVSLAVEIAKKKKEVIFLVNSGSPHTYISRDVLEAMCFECKTEEVIGNVNGHQHILTISDPNTAENEIDFGEVNILGGNFLTLAGAVLNVNYNPEKKMVSIKFS